MSTFDLFHVSDEERARAAAHARMAAAQAAHIPDIPADTPLRPVQRVAVIGAGTMGGGIAMSLANIGIPVTLIDSSAQGLERGLARVKDNYATTVKRGKLSPADMEQRLALITGTLQMADVKDADMVIEAVFEDMGLKQDIFRQLDTLAKPGAILATNTSGLDVDAIAT
ncbi:MAG: 3-hydroxyacyl-CoA dehydrogenase NAD-binding domain-containing protein, partial [Hydrogenophaga sp.]|nr:3-hydroxyacyl-CoA dehydrogenase NAD-binding domain-containing protein [Hydrogenophaga sp.]